MKLLCDSQKTRTFYLKLIASRNGFVSRAGICRDKDGGLLTDGRVVIERWKQRTIVMKSGQFVCFVDDMNITGTFGKVAEL